MTSRLERCRLVPEPLFVADVATTAAPRARAAPPSYSSVLSPWLYVGGLPATAEPPPSIQHAISVACDQDVVWPHGDHKQVTFVDNVDTVVDCVGWLGKRHGQPTLVHCQDGQRQSAIIAVAYMMYLKRMPFDAAYNLVRSAHPRMNMAIESAGHLMGMEPNLHALPPPKLQ